jgi:hypothetical protein
MRQSVFVLLLFAVTCAHTAEVSGEAVTDKPINIRHDVAQPSQPIVTLHTDLRFLSGSTWQNPPQYLPSVD